MKNEKKTIEERNRDYMALKTASPKNVGRGAVKSRQPGGLTKLEERDKSYLLHTLDIFEQSLLIDIDQNDKGLTNSRTTPFEMATLIIEYFRFCITGGMQITLSGIGLYLGYDKKEFLKKLNDIKDPAYNFLSRCVYFVEMYMEYTAQRKQNPAFQIFWLKNRGWVDKLEISATSTQGALSDEEREAAQKRISSFSEVK